MERRQNEPNQAAFGLNAAHTPIDERYAAAAPLRIYKALRVIDAIGTRRYGIVRFVVPCRGLSLQRKYGGQQAVVARETPGVRS